MQRVGRVSTTGAGKSTEHSTHEGLRAGKAERFRDAVSHAGQRDDGGSGQPGQEQGEQHGPVIPLDTDDLVVLR